MISLTDAKNSLRCVKGQALVEFALVALLLVTLLLAITEFARAWHCGNIMTNGARAGARFASEQPKQPNAQTFTSNVTNYTFGQITAQIGAVPGGDVFVNLSATGRSGQAKTFDNISSGDTISVIVTYDFRALSGEIIPVLDGTVPIVRRAAMMYQGPQQ